MSQIKESIKTQDFEYNLDGKDYLGYFAVDSEVKGKRPGILVIHEWWGLNDYPKMRARQLAELGYVAFAMDVYGKGIVTNDHNEAGKLSGANGDSKSFLKKINYALKLLKENPDVDPNKIGAIGYCFGGKGVIEIALDGQELKGGVVSFHGMLMSQNLKTGAKKVKTKMLVHHGAADPFMDPKMVEEFVKTLKDANAPLEFVSHPGAKHGFTKLGAEKHGLDGLAYNAEADAKSFQSMKEFFATNFK
ncbi:MAG: dienelactone hydrolase family protein [Leptospiraceae bacterium]|nr:dienelactone hydrolase family protein [Leptospiraceae bacterium]MCP5510302.1 dienelactone hydrolase family protein [Leptospiraceae bacterium]